MSDKCSFSDLAKCSECSSDIYSLMKHDNDSVINILSEVGIVLNDYSNTCSSYTICSTHFNNLSKINANRRRRKFCEVPSLISAHQQPGKVCRYLNHQGAQRIKQGWGVTLPVNSAICTNCRKKLLSIDEGDRSENSHDSDQIQLKTNEHNEVEKIFPEMDCSMENISIQNQFQNSQGSGDTDMVDGDTENTDFGSQTSFQTEESIELLNKFLFFNGKKPLPKPENKWSLYSERSRRRYCQLFKELFTEFVSSFFPDEEADVLTYMWQSTEERDLTETDIVSALIASYKNTSVWQIKRQILSVLTVSLNLKNIQKHIPGLTEYRYYIAQKHSILYGCAMPPPEREDIRQKMDPLKLSSFLDFITSSHIIKDLPFGEKRLKLSSGEVMDVPNIIRCMGPAAIIQQYKVYCEEKNIECLGMSTMYRIMSQCSAAVRKSLEGLDYFIAEGTRAFQEMQDIIQEPAMIQSQECSSQEKDTVAALLETKRYLKADYKIHIAEASQVADHCRAYGLSSKEKEFSKDCDHEHNNVCEFCEQLEEILKAITVRTEETSFQNQTVEDDLIYRLKQAKDNIHSWKMHIMRARNQEAAKSKLLNTMEANELFLVFDWAMKFLPRKYRGDQLNWFGKRGISWHISVVFRRVGTELQTMTYIHIFEGAVSQDATTSSAVICDVINSVLSIHPTIKKLHLWSDNAACYKCAETFTRLKNNDLSVGKLCSYDFCESQDGKGPCDRTAATLKSNIKRYVDRGNDVENAAQMKKAIDATKKNIDYKVKVAALKPRPRKVKGPKPTIPHITSYHNFAFEKDCLRVWKAYGIGTGLCIPWNTIETEDPLPDTGIVVLEDTADQTAFHVIRKANEDNDDQQDLFTCPTDGCMKSFSKYKDLEMHVHVNDCKLVPEKACSTDRIKVMYVEKLQSCEVRNPPQLTGTEVKGEVQRSRGWALKKDREKTNFNKKQKDFLDSIFQKGDSTGNKADPKDVSREMRHLKGPNGERHFTPKEFLTEQQITGYFSRMSQKRKPTFDEKSFKSARHERAMEELNKTILKELA